jgi:hypothetical protein
MPAREKQVYEKVRHAASWNDSLVTCGLIAFDMTLL